MPSPERTLDLDTARRLVASRSFRPSAGHLVGVELEWLVFTSTDLASDGSVSLTRLQQAVASAGPLPGGGVVTYEPGGQLELSSAAGTLAETLRLTETDAIVLRDALDRAGLTPVGLGLDPLRPRRRVVDTPRYSAMEAYFDAGGPAGRTMMCGTAALQISLDTGPPDEIERRWARAHHIGPLLLAAFANSPLLEGRPSGWRSSRWGAWNRIDPSRTASVYESDGAGDGGDQWARYALDAAVMLILAAGDAATPVLESLTFGDWVEHGHDLGWPTVDDLTYHLSTLFPPVRPQGRFELRMIDALPDPWWRAAIAVTTALLDDPETAAVAEVATEPVRNRWCDAAQHGLSDPDFARAARTCFDAALDAMPRLGVGRSSADVLQAFNTRFVNRGRTPADERLD
ncbi:MAG: ergothioneine biosynthesis glutamate--cysteine ligase EgtA, partial [Acidimicrobiia bacterium]